MLPDIGKFWLFSETLDYIERNGRTPELFTARWLPRSAIRIPDVCQADTDHWDRLLVGLEQNCVKT
jgi:hypothetical protein